jgi:hypothetical protein
LGRNEAVCAARSTSEGDKRTTLRLAARFDALGLSGRPLPTLGPNETDKRQFEFLHTHFGQVVEVQDSRAVVMEVALVEAASAGWRP